MTADDDDLLRALGDAVRAAEHAPERAALERLSAGTLADDELADLRRRASEDPALARALEAHAPLDAATRARIAARAVAAARARGGDDEPAAGEDDALDGGAAVASLAAHRARRTRRASWAALPVVAAAAAALLWIGRGAERAPALPRYTALVSGGEARMRALPAAQTGSADEALPPVRVGAQTRLRVTLRPMTAIGGAPIDARVYMVGAHGVMPWPSELQRADSGALQLLLYPPPAPLHGASAAVIVVARTAVLEQRGDELLRLPFARGADYQRWRMRLEADVTTDADTDTDANDRE
jgi:hypothetical protein